MARKPTPLSPTDQAMELAMAHARSAMLPFTQWTYPGDFMVNWHHRVLGRALDNFIDRVPGYENIMVFMPPGTGKSQMISRHMPAKIFGKRPRARILACSYAAELAEANNRDVQAVMESEEYHYLFPETVIAQPGQEVEGAKGTYVRNATTFQTIPHRGIYRCAGVGGSILGTRGDYIIIDDPLKNKDEAESETVRNQVYEWYRSTLYSRRAKGAGICIVMQRWHDDDLAGRLLKMAKEDPDYPQFHVVKFPMISTDERLEHDPRDTPGIPLWPGMFDAAECRGIQKTQGSRNWQAMYQQEPNEEGGNEIKAAWFKTWDRLPEYPDRVIISVDAAFKATTTSSFVAVEVWMQKGPNFYLADQDRRRMGFLETIDAILALRARWPSVYGVLIEDKANGPAIIETLKLKIPGVMEAVPHGSKLARLRAVSPTIQSGNVFLPSPETHEWVPAFIKELTTAPNCKDWDQVDTTSQALHYFLESAPALALLNQD